MENGDYYTTIMEWIYWWLYIYWWQASHLDPMLDDSIMFARRLQSLGKEVHLELISDLPHGFLNFVLVSREAMAASKRCVSNIQSMLDLNSS